MAHIGQTVRGFPGRATVSRKLMSFSSVPHGDEYANIRIIGAGTPGARGDDTSPTLVAEAYASSPPSDRA